MNKKNIIFYIFIINIFFKSNNLAYEKRSILEAAKFLSLPEKTTCELINLITTEQSDYSHYFHAQKPVDIFENYPDLKKSISYIQLTDLPTPIKQLNKIAKFYNVPNLYVKCDNLTGKLLSKNQRIFGGNKLRKLEFLLGDAIAHQAHAIMTTGCAGSNHAAATALCTQEINLDCILMLKPQHNTHTTRRNLLLDLYSSAVMFHDSNNILRTHSIVHVLTTYKQNFGKFPYFIPNGGSIPLGIIGYVNAAFELKNQINKKEIPEPDRIYMAVGSYGTITGLYLGLKAAGLKSKIYGINIEPDPVDFEKIKELFDETNKILHKADKNFPVINFDKNDLNIINQFAGTDYALYTQEGADAIKKALIHENLELDGVYTGKTFSGLLYDLKNKKINNNEVVLFWNTYFSENCEDLIKDLDYKKLPKVFHNYFENDVQLLDRE